MKKFPTTSKIFIALLIFICLQIVIFAEWAMIQTNDLSSMYVLVGIPAAVSPSLISYMIKSRDENISKYGRLETGETINYEGENNDG